MLLKEDEIRRFAKSQFECCLAVRSVIANDSFRPPRDTILPGTLAFAFRI